MSIDTNRYGHALDTQGLSQLKADLKAPNPETAKAVARQFESLFLQTMLKSMRAGMPTDGPMGGEGESQYRDLLDRQLSMNASQGRGIGLAPVIERQILQNMGLKPDNGPALNPTLQSYREAPLPAPRAIKGLPPLPVLNARPAPEQPAPASEVGGKGAGWGSPQEFIRSVWDSAEKAARKLGVSAKALVAQAALETGWGKHVIRRADGQSSFNLFGIKSHRSWDGDSVKVPTLEFRNGVAAKELASFRAYGSLDECFEDYARFLQSNPRYRDALAAEDDESFVKGLQAAGYATDPEYANKILRIMENPGLKNSDQRTTS